jgi:hypothetical protein
VEILRENQAQIKALTIAIKEVNLLINANISNLN